MQQRVQRIMIPYYGTTMGCPHQSKRGEQDMMLLYHRRCQMMMSQTIRFNVNTGSHLRAAPLTRYSLKGWDERTRFHAQSTVVFLRDRNPEVARLVFALSNKSFRAKTFENREKSRVPLLSSLSLFSFFFGLPPAQRCRRSA